MHARIFLVTLSLKDESCATLTTHFYPSRLFNEVDRTVRQTFRTNFSEVNSELTTIVCACVCMCALTTRAFQLNLLSEKVFKGRQSLISTLFNSLGCNIISTPLMLPLLFYGWELKHRFIHYRMVCPAILNNIWVRDVHVPERGALKSINLDEKEREGGRGRGKGETSLIANGTCPRC